MSSSRLSKRLRSELGIVSQSQPTATYSTRRAKYGPYKRRSRIPRSITALKEQYGVTFIRRNCFFDLIYDSNIGYSWPSLTGSGKGFGLDFHANSIFINFGTSFSQNQIINDLNNGLVFNDIADLFDQYMIDRIDMVVSASTQARSNSEELSQFRPGANPTLMTCIDYTDNYAPDISDMLQDANCKTTYSFDSMRVHKNSVRPCYQQVVAWNGNSINTGTQDINTKPARGYLNTNLNSLVDHYGIKVYCENPGSGPTDPENPAMSQMHRFYFTYHFKCKETI